MTRAVVSQYTSGVARGKRSAKEAGGIQHMVLAELQLALKRKSTQNRELARKFM